MKIYVGNLSRSTTEETLKTAFEQFGQVDSVNIKYDRETRQPRGFGFVDMPNAEQAQAAMAGMNGRELDGRPLRVNEAREIERAPGGGGGRPGGFGGRGPRSNGGGFRNGGGFNR